MEAYYLGNVGSGSGTPTFSASVPVGALVLYSQFGLTPGSLDSRGNIYAGDILTRHANFGGPYFDLARTYWSRIRTEIQIGDTIDGASNAWSLDAFSGLSSAVVVSGGGDTQRSLYGPVYGYAGTSKVLNTNTGGSAFQATGGSLLISFGYASATAAPCAITDSMSTLLSHSPYGNDEYRVAYRIVPANTTGNQSETLQFSNAPDNSLDIGIAAFTPDRSGRASVYDQRGARHDFEVGYWGVRHRETATDGGEGEWLRYVIRPLALKPYDLGASNLDLRGCSAQVRRDGRLLVSYTDDGTAQLIGSAQGRMNNLALPIGVPGLAVNLGSPYYGVAHWLDERDGILAAALYSVADRSWYLKVGTLNAAGTTYTLSSAVLLAASAHNSASILRRRDGVWEFQYVALDGTVTKLTCLALSGSGGGTWS